MSNSCCRARVRTVSRCHLAIFSHERSNTARIICHIICRLTRLAACPNEEMNAGTCRRIKFTPLPFGLSLVTTGFVMLWLVLLPFGLTTSEKDSTATMIVSTWIAGLALFILSAMLLAIDEAANQLEDPFHSLPLFDATKTAMAHLSIVAQDFAKMKTATASTSVE